jgi:hypothetical protein
MAYGRFDEAVKSNQAFPQLVDYLKFGSIGCFRVCETSDDFESLSADLSLARWTIQNLDPCWILDPC